MEPTRRSVTKASALVAFQSVSQAGVKGKERETLLEYLQGFLTMPRIEQEQEWDSLLTKCTVEARRLLLDRLWQRMPDDKKLETGQALLLSMHRGHRFTLAAYLTERLCLEDRNEITEHLLRQLSAHEMDCFCDCFPSIWADFTVPFTTRLVNRLQPVQRRHLVMQIQQTAEVDVTERLPWEVGHDLSGDISNIAICKLEPWCRHVPSVYSSPKAQRLR